MGDVPVGGVAAVAVGRDVEVVVEVPGNPAVVEESGVGEECVEEGGVSACGVVEGPELEPVEVVGGVGEAEGHGRGGGCHGEEGGSGGESRHGVG